MEVVDNHLRTEASHGQGYDNWAGCGQARAERVLGLLGRFAPDGRLDRMLELGVPFVTCPAFGGPDLDVMYLTSISHTHTMRNPHPLSGRLFELCGLGVKGIAETPVHV